MSRRRPAKAILAEIVNKLQQQLSRAIQDKQKWLNRELRKHRAQPIWRRWLLVTWRVIEIILTQIQKIGKQQWKKGRNLWLSTQRSFPRAGFILPMVSVLLVVFSLVAAGLLMQSMNRTTEVAATRNEQVIYNSATVAIDRAKAKIEYMFNKDPRWPRSLPTDTRIDHILLNGSATNSEVDPLDLNPATPSTIEDPYRFPDEQRLDLNNDGRADNAWTFTINTDGGTARVAYMILHRVQSDNIFSGTTRDDREASDQLKAANLLVRNGPINMTQPSQVACIQTINSPTGWEVITGATVRRAFQTFVVVIEDRGAQRNVSTLEMQQDREADQGNKWGAWFRNDLEVFPGPDFRWNGALHTEGNMIIGGDSTTFSSYLISSPNSCLYARQNSEITIGGNLDESTPPFLGQLVRGSLKTNGFGGSFVVHTHGPNGPQNTYTVDDPANPTGNNHRDSVTNTTTGLTPGTISLDPVALFTTNQSISRSTTNPVDENNTNVRDPLWKTSGIVTQGRIFNRSALAPYVDDTYRADNRYGPRPRYTQLIDLNNFQVGTTILPSHNNADILLADSPNEPEASGLDGYWERRGRYEGMTIITGQRLELGNMYGWGGVEEPLYPPLPRPQTGESATICNVDNTNNNSRRCHEQRQWKTLRDNLAAVQSTVVYHNDRQLVGNDERPVMGEFPLACLATTSHHGTRTGTNALNTNGLGEGGTIGNSRFFGLRNANVDTNFLIGVGTNGWEFNPPAGATTNSAFGTAIASGTNLRQALTNLANFAGDPYGAFPPRQDSRDGVNSNDAVPSVGPVVHPYPFLTMWGDFSNLRRVIALLDGGTSYSNLSMADQTTLQTAACTLGMLAYNLNNMQAYNYSTNAAALQSDIQQVLRALKVTCTTGATATCVQGRIAALPGGADSAYPEDYIRVFNAITTAASFGGTTNTKTNQALVPTLEAIYWKEQITRDRAYGFFDYTDSLNTSTTLTGYTTNRPVKFNPATNGNFGITNQDDLKILARTLGPRGVKFPAFFYIFPSTNHNHGATSTTFVQPTTEPYIGDTYIAAVNSGLTYTAVDPANIILSPRARANWVLPRTTTTTASASNPVPVNLIRDNTVTPNTYVGTALQDKVMFNGREMMAVRVLDVDLDLLRKNTISRESWLPYSGVVYAFREDAVREDAIARPTRSGVTFALCNRAATLGAIPTLSVPNNCLMDAVTATPADPPVNNTNGISPKPVDFYSDPDRRPHGFRLRNGSDLRRSPSPPSVFQFKGLAFISDNPVYIVPDPQNNTTNYTFNDHRNATTNNRIEEFGEANTTTSSQLLATDWSNFYTGRTTVNVNFGKAGDTWRPAEVIADAVSIVSRNFIDGSIAEGIDMTNVGNNSYRTLNAPSEANTNTTGNLGPRRWVREDGTISDANVAIPIKISRNGFPLYCVNTSGGTDIAVPSAPNDTQFDYCRRNGFRSQEYGREASTSSTNPLNAIGWSRTSNRAYETFSTGKTTIGAQTDSRVNATIVSGLVPSRGGQSYGGLHNFPRFLESWSGSNLFISGAFIQLNFSTYAAAPFDQDSWEPGQAANASSELINYYGAPTRRWGYDVALQYSPAGPVASRFITPSNNRSEFYREPAVDDPYICLLRKARYPNGTSANIDTNTSTCP